MVRYQYDIIIDNYITCIYIIHIYNYIIGQCIIVMRHGARLDTADPSWERTLGVDRPYDTPLTGKGKIEAYHIATKQFRDKV